MASDWRKKNLKVNSDLAKERRSGTFDPQELTYIIDGSQEKTEQRRRIGKQETL